MTEPRRRSRNRRHEHQFFYKYVSARVAKIVLATRKLRWSSPLLFNDPFDVTQELRLNFDEAELSAALVSELAQIIVERGSVSDRAHPAVKLLVATLRDNANPDQRRQIADELRNDPGSPTVGQLNALAALKRVWSEIVPRFRILCLSELNDVTSMWHHYADSYRGAVLRFVAVDEIDSAWLVARPVTYQAEPPAIADKQEWARSMLRPDGKTHEELFGEYQYVKTPDWSSEHEWRVVALARPGEEGLFSDWSFHPRELSGVYLGPKCSTEDETEILSLLSQGIEHVAAFRARVATRATAKFSFAPIP